MRQQYGDDVEERLRAFSMLAEETLELHRQLAREYLDRTRSMWQATTETAAAHHAPNLATGVAFEGLVLAKKHNLDAGWPVVFQALQMEWLRLGWPLKNMTREHWQRLRALWETECDATLQSATAGNRRLTNQLPGGLLIEPSRDWLRIKSH